MLNWLFFKKNVEKALQGGLAKKTEVEVHRKKVHLRIAEENINLRKIRDYFTMDDCDLVMQVLERIKVFPLWIRSV